MFEGVKSPQEAHAYTVDAARAQAPSVTPVDEFPVPDPRPPGPDPVPQPDPAPMPEPLPPEPLPPPL